MFRRGKGIKNVMQQCQGIRRMKETGRNVRGVGRRRPWQWVIN
jgi:hypothetical protein